MEMLDVGTIALVKRFEEIQGNLYQRIDSLVDVLKEIQAELSKNNEGSGDDAMKIIEAALGAEEKTKAYSTDRSLWL